MFDKHIVLVQWLDAHESNDKWIDKDEAEAYGGVDCTVTSVGFVVRKTEKYLTIAGDYDPIDGDYGRVTKIPISCIVSSVDLK